MENKVVVNESHLINMADSIRTLTGSSGSLTMENMVAGLSGAADGEPYTSGTFTLTTRSSKLINHGLNEIPGSILLYRTNSNYSVIVNSSRNYNSQSYTIFSCSKNEKYHVGSYFTNTRQYGGTNSYYFYSSNCTNNSLFFSSTSNYYFITNVTSTSFNTPSRTNGSYFWIALR